MDGVADEHDDNDDDHDDDDDDDDVGGEFFRQKNPEQQKKFLRNTFRTKLNFFEEEQKVKIFESFVLLKFFCLFCF